MSKKTGGGNYYELVNFYYEALVAKKSSSFVSNMLKDMTDILSAYSKKDVADYVGYLYAASAYSTWQTLYASKDKERIYEALQFYLSHLQLNVEIDDKGKVLNQIEAKVDATLFGHRIMNHGACLPKEGNKEDAKVIEVRKDSTVIQIQNLNIYLTADVVHQLNMNPKEVINNNIDAIQKAAVEAVKQALQNGGLEKLEGNNDNNK